MLRHGQAGGQGPSKNGPKRTSYAKTSQGSFSGGFHFEPLEPRLLLSAGAEGGAAGAAIQDAQQVSQQAVEAENFTFADQDQTFSADLLAAAEIQEDAAASEQDTSSKKTEDSPPDKLANEDSSPLAAAPSDPFNEEGNENVSADILPEKSDELLSASAEDQAEPREEFTVDRSELVIVDPGITDYQPLVDDLLDNRDGGFQYEIVVLDPETDGISQISELLAEYQDLDAVHIVSHGTDRAVKLGSVWVYGENFGAYQEDIAGWKSSLAGGADLLFYGCDLAAGEGGQALLRAFASLTGADVAASADDTGHADYNGDWELEYEWGDIETEIAFSADIEKSWTGLLNTFTVTTYTDSATEGSGSLRRAIIEANALAGADIISLPSGTYTLTITGTLEDLAATGDLDIRDELTIQGAGAAATVIDGNGLDRVFHVLAGTGYTGKLTMSDVTVKGGIIAAGTGGGGILVDSSGELSLSNAIVTGNDADEGGGIQNLGTASLTDVEISQNGTSVPSKGGGFYNEITGTATLTRVIVSANQADGGGGIRNDGTIFLTDVEISTNATSSGGIGGGLQNIGSATLDRVTVSANSAGTGGGIHTDGVSLTITNSTISGNTGSTGGGLYVKGSIEIINSTIAYNTAGRGLWVASGGNSATLTNTILASNTGGNAAGTVNSGPDSLDTDTMSDPSTLNLDSNLQDNGGFTKTHALLAGSAAIDTGNTVGAPAVDQRGVARDATPDVGAYEHVAGGANTAPTLSSFSAPIDTTNEDTEVELTFAELAAQGDEADVDGTVVAFVVQALSTGTLRIGADSGSATIWTAGTNDTIDATNNAYWTPAANANGTLNAFSVVAEDNEGAESATPVQAQVAVTAVNDLPTGAVTIDNTAPAEDDLLTAANTLADEDGLGAISYQWQRDGADIAGATSNTYTVTQADVGAQISVVASYVDGQGTAESVSSALTAAVTNLNDAPVLDNTGSPALTAINENETNNTGDLVSAIIAGAITDADIGALEGIAVVSVDDSHGQWEYNTGSGWTAFGAVSESSTVVLDDSADIRFVPAINFNGTALIAYRAWDRTDGNSSGAAGVDASIVGGATPFSTASETASITVTPVELVLHLATSGDVTGSGVPGPQTWTNGELLAFGDPNISFGAGTTDGTFSSLFNLGNYVTNSKEISIDSLHVVSSNITVGGAGGTVDLQRDDILFSIEENTVAFSGLSATVSQKDVVRFRPSDETFEIVLDNVALPSSINGMTLVEKNTTFDDGATLSAGSFLLTSGTQNGIFYLAPVGAGDSVNSGSPFLFFDGLDPNISIGTTSNYIDGIDLIEDDISPGNATLTAGQLLITLQKDDNDPLDGVGSNHLGVTANDIFCVTLTGTELGSGFTAGTATMFIQGADVSLNTSEERVNALSFDAEFGIQSADPVIDLPGGIVIYTEGDSPTIIDGAATLSDTDSGDFERGQFRVDLAVGGSADDRLAVHNEGNGSGEVGVSGNTVSYGGIAIGTVTGGESTQPLVVTLNASSTREAVEAVMQNITFENVSGAPSTVPRTVRFELTDGDGGASNVVTETINITAVNDAPVVSAPAAALEATEQTPLLIHGEGFSVNDVDAASGVVQAILSVGEGTLTVVAGDSGATVSGGNSTGTVVLTGTIAQIDHLLTFTGTGTITYLNSLDAPSASTMLTVTVNDQGHTGTDPGLTGGGSSEEGTNSVAINITAVDDPPLVNDAGVSLAESTANGTLVHDVDDANTGGDTDADGQAISYTITAGNDDGVFAIDGVTGQITVVDNTNLDYETTNQYMLIVEAGDGGQTDTATITVDITDANDPPTITLNNTTTVLAEDTDTSSRIKVADIAVADDALGTYALSLSGADATLFEIDGTELYLNADASLDYESNATLQVTVQVYDFSIGPGTEDTTTLNINITDANDAPTGAVTISDTTPAEDQVLTVSNTLADEDGLGAISYQWQKDGVDIAGATGAAYTTSQADVGAQISVVASYTDGYGTSESVSSAATAAVVNVNDAPTGAVTISDTTPAEDQVLTVSNTLADEDGLSTISYQWRRNGVDITGATANTYISSQADVGALISVVASYTDEYGTSESVASAPTAAVVNVNDAPSATHLNTPETYTEDTTLNLTDIVVADVDSATLTVTLTLSDPAAGTLSTGTSGTVSASFAGGVWTASGAIADVNTLLASVAFTPASGYNGDFTISVSVDDGAAPAVAGVKNITLASPAAPPPTVPVDDNTTDPEPVVEPEPEPPAEEPEPAVEEEAAEEEDSLSEEASGGTVAAGTQASSSQSALQQGFFGSPLRDSEEGAVRNFTYDGGMGNDLSELQPAPTDTQPAWYQPTPKLTISDPNFQKNAFEILTARAFEFLENSLDGLKEETASDIEYNKAVLSTSIAVATGLSMGYVAWLLRSGILLSSLLSSMPAWRFLDPLPILAGRRDDSEEEDEESLEAIIEKGSQAKVQQDKKDLSAAEALS